MKKPLPASREFAYLRKWVPIAILIGIIAGLGSIVFYESINIMTNVLLGQFGGYIPPAPAGEGESLGVLPSHPYAIPIITTLGGLISGIIVFGLAPEAEGHGTDAAIDAFHNKKGSIRSRIPVIKLVASAVTIGSGGSAGREGPTAQIGAGFGSFLGKALHLSIHDRRIAVAVGIGAGIGSIFKAPFGGAILSTEILYIGDFEVEALLPSFIASTIGYSIFASVIGWTPIFGFMNQTAFTDPIDLPAYAVLGLACGLVGIIYIKTFYGTKDFFQKMKIPNFVKPAIGGLAVGIIGIFLPQILGTGYGWLQIAMNGNFNLLPFAIIPIVMAVKILATSLSVGSGGSGGIFAPALMIGGLVGAIIWALLSIIIPSFQPVVGAFVVVGMMAFFGGVGKVPVAVILMVSEMTGGLTLLVPSMIATTIAYVITGRNTMYRSQVASRADSPSHRGEYSIPLMQKLFVKDAMTNRVLTIGSSASLTEAADVMSKNGIKGIPVLDGENNLIGIIALMDVLRIHPTDRSKEAVADVMTREVITATPDENLQAAFGKMADNQIGRLPVVDSRNTKRLVGMITRGDIWRIYNIEIRSRLEDNKLSGSIGDSTVTEFGAR